MYKIPDKLPTDPMLADLVPEFLEQWVKDLTVTFPEIRESRSIEELRRFGHTLKGSFLQFGFKDLSVVGRHIMEDAEANRWVDADGRVHILLEILTELQRRMKDGEI
jgi:chemotaxis protein histidine kinase CheA